MLLPWDISVVKGKAGVNQNKMYHVRGSGGRKGIKEDGGGRKEKSRG